MKMTECLREHEVMESVGGGRWPDRCPDELRAHIAACALCRDVLEVAVALHEDRDTAHLNAQISSAGLVWWRAEMRARRDAVQRATRPMRIFEWAALACMLAAMGALLYWIGPSGLKALLWQPSLAFFAGLGLLILLSSVVCYFVLSRD